ncbi:CCA tRNA nucleotidyltransferase [Chloroflexota bacterium]
MPEKNFKPSIDPRSLALLSRINDFLVRDSLLRRETADIDIALSANALDIARQIAAVLGGRYVRLDEVNRVGRVVMANQEAPPAKGRWEIDLSTIKTDIEGDLRERDFTVDAMAVDLQDLGEDRIEIIDPFHGLEDLDQRLIRSVTETAFASDPLRLLRAVRLAAELGFTIDGQTELLIRRQCHLIANVAAERVREELLPILAQSSRFLRYLDSVGLLVVIIPEIARLKGVRQPPEHFWDVFDHSLEAVAAADYLLRQGAPEYATDHVLSAVPWSEALAPHFAQEVSRGSTRRSLLKLAALLHDIAKPQTKATEENGRIRFLGHAIEGAAITVNIFERLRFSTREVKLVEAMVRHHLRPTQMSQGELPTRRAIYRYLRDTGDAAIDTLFLNLADHLATRGPQLELAEWQRHARLVSYVLAERQQEERFIRPPKLIDGHDVINSFGLSPGPKIGKLLESVRELQDAGEVTNKQEALAYIQKQLSPTTGPSEAEDGG